jgi:hypothetical protein
MAIKISEVLDVMAAYEIFAEEPPADGDAPQTLEHELPEIGEVREGETIYTTSLDRVFEEDDKGEFDILSVDDPRIGDWWDEVRRIIEAASSFHDARNLRREAPEPECAWYCPIHFFRHGWGIYIRESCILSCAKEVALYVNWRLITAPHASIARQLLRSAFYVFFLHEQFHHKVESFGFRLLISTASDRYRAYKSKVYRPTYRTKDCLEESLANADSYRRLGEARYTQRVDRPIREGLRDLLKASFSVQPPGYAEAKRYLSETAYRDGLFKLQSQILDGALAPTTPAGRWSLAPNMITALTDITDDIYVILPVGARPIFRPTSVDPGATVSTRALVGALTRHYGYQHVAGGKGSHVKLKKPGAQTIIIPGNKAVLSPGVVKHALGAIGSYPISRLPDLLEGRLPANL